MQSQRHNASTVVRAPRTTITAPMSIGAVESEAGRTFLAEVYTRWSVEV